MYKGYKIIDSHVHIYKDKIAEKATETIGEFYHLDMDENGSVTDLLRTAQGVDRFVVHSAATTPKQVRIINEFISGQVALHDDFIGYGTLHPDMDDPEAEVEWMLEHGLRGVKLHPDFQEFDIDCERAIRLYKCCAGKLLILFHVGDETRHFTDPKKLLNVIDAVPDLSIIAAHMGGYSKWEQSRKYLIGQTNIFMDTSSTLFKLPAAEASEMIHEHGTDKILFGTDFPMWNFESEFERFMKLSLTEEERIAILSGNAAKLLGIEL